MTTPSIVDYIGDSLSRSVSGKGRVTVEAVRSQPRRSYALFPHASNHKACKVWQEEVLAVLYNDNDATTTRVPVCAVEASIYTIPSTETAIVYIAKVDTTGLERAPPGATKLFVSSFVRFHLEHPPHGVTRVRVHVFARSQGQYLFPGSVDNTDCKRVLDDKQLLRWWKSTLSIASSTPLACSRFYLVPGLDYLESVPYVPNNPGSGWTYGHPYSTLSSPLHSISSSSSPSSPSSFALPDHVPAFPDDPKSRFLHALTSSALSPAGAEGDYDDVHHQIHQLAFASGNPSTPQRRLDEVEHERERERSRLVRGVEGGVEEWWERMQFRQECCSGVLVGFFVVAIGEPQQQQQQQQQPAPPPPEPTSSNKSSCSGTRDPTGGRTLQGLSESTQNPLKPLTDDDDDETKDEPESIKPTTTTTTTTTSTADIQSPSSSSFTVSQQQQQRHHHHPPPPSPYPVSLPHSTFTKLWTEFHNQDYSLPNVSTVLTNLKKWSRDVERLVKIEVEKGTIPIGPVERTVEIDNHNDSDDEPGKKRSAEASTTAAEEGRDPVVVGMNAKEIGTTNGSTTVRRDEVPKVNMLAPRKKKKVV